MKGAEVNRRFSVVLNDTIARRINEFSATTGISKDKVVELAINRFLNDPDVIVRLVNGYMEMANLNREITKAFTPCEEDAELHLLEYRLKEPKKHS
mgnify:CR=1 FL=1